MRLSWRLLVEAGLEGGPVLVVGEVGWCVAFFFACDVLEDADGLGPAAVAVVVGDKSEAAGFSIDDAAGAILRPVDLGGGGVERGAEWLLRKASLIGAHVDQWAQAVIRGRVNINEAPRCVLLGIRLKGFLLLNGPVDCLRGEL